MELTPICLGGASGWVNYQVLGSERWKTIQLKSVREWVQRALIPASVILRPGTDLGFSFYAPADRPKA